MHPSFAIELLKTMPVFTEPPPVYGAIANQNIELLVCFANVQGVRKRLAGVLVVTRLLF